MKTVQAPSKGRVVFFQESDGGDTWAAHVADVDPDDPSRVKLAILNPVVKPGRIVFPSADYVPYGENKPGCWWWPPRIDATIEVEE